MPYLRRARVLPPRGDLLTNHHAVYAVQQAVGGSAEEDTVSREVRFDTECRHRKCEEVYQTNACTAAGHGSKKRKWSPRDYTRLTFNNAKSPVVAHWQWLDICWRCRKHEYFHAGDSCLLASTRFKSFAEEAAEAAASEAAETT
jgi:hypothetical protein